MPGGVESGASSLPALRSRADEAAVNANAATVTATTVLHVDPIFMVSRCSGQNFREGLRGRVSAFAPLLDANAERLLHSEPDTRHWIARRRDMNAALEASGGST